MNLDVRAMYISGGMHPEDVSYWIAKFKEGHLKDADGHRITAIWNDRMIEMGYDDPNATVVYSLKPSMFSTEPTQQLGRATRKPDEDYQERTGRPQKIALAFNVRTSGMNPYRFGEVLAGSKEIYSNRYKEYLQSNDAPKEVYIPDGIQVNTALDEVTTLRADQYYKQPISDERKALLAGCEPKGLYWKAVEDWRDDIRTYNHAGFDALWTAIKTAYFASPHTPVVIDGHEVKCGIKRSPNLRAPFCVHADEKEWLKNKIGKNLDTKKPGWKRKDESATVITVGKANEEYDALWSLLKETYDADPTKPLLVDGHRVQFARLQAEVKAITLKVYEEIKPLIIFMKTKKIGLEISWVFLRRKRLNGAENRNVGKRI